jgi:NAD(P)H-dependent FMN reductase
MRLLFFAGSTREGSYNRKLALLGRHIAGCKSVVEALAGAARKFVV